MAGQAGRQYAIKDIHASHYPLDQVARCTDAHQIPGLVLGQNGIHNFKKTMALLEEALRLANAAVVAGGQPPAAGPPEALYTAVAGD
jgi:hypothetical protein